MVPFSDVFTCTIVAELLPYAINYSYNTISFILATRFGGVFDIIIDRWVLCLS